MQLSRRELLALASASASLSLARCGPRPEPESLPDEAITTFSSARAMAEAIRGKQVSSVELVQACLARIEEVNPAINAVVALARDRALSEANRADEATARGESLGPLHGVPMTIKDSLDTEGVVTTAGTVGRRDYVPERDATVVARLRAAGAVLLGKTNTPELTFAGETDNLVYGRTRNPYDLERTPGGSSGGAAAIIASGGSPFDIGSDTGGSIRIPANFCGIAGLKPTSGRVPRTGHIVAFEDAWESLTTLGPLARYVEDLALLLPTLSGPDGFDPGVVPARLGLPHEVALESLRGCFYVDNGDVPANGDTVKVVAAAVTALNDAGVVMESSRPDPIPLAMELILSLITSDGGAGIRRRLELAGTGPGEHHRFLSGFLDPSTAVSGAELAKRIETWQTYRRDMLRFMTAGRYDFIVCPAWAHEAPPHTKPGEEDKSVMGVNYTAPYNLTGWPAVVVRGGSASGTGLPIGVQVIGRPWREDVVLAVAGRLETALGGYQAPVLA